MRDIEKLSNLVDLLKEESLNKCSISTENFSVQNLLTILKNRKSFNPDFFLYQFESDLIYFYENLKNNEKLEPYKKKIRKLLDLQISDLVIEETHVVLIKLCNEFLLEDSNIYTVKRLL
jgi:hypothetical protein